MMEQSFRTRYLAFAYLFGPPRFVERTEAMQVYNAVSEALGFDDLTLKYASPEAVAPPRSRGFQISLSRQEGRGGLTISVGNKSVQEPIQMLVTYTWPQAPDYVNHLFDEASRAVFDTLRPPEGGWQRVMAEARVRGQCNVRQNNGLRFMRDSVLALPAEWLESLGEPLQLASVRLEVGASAHSEDPLGGPRREFTIEPLREDPTGVYVELMSQWKQRAGHAESGGIINGGGTGSLPETPSSYVDETIEFLRERLSEFNDPGSNNA